MGSLRIPLLDKITGKLPSSVLPDLSGNYVPLAQAGVAGGVATLDGSGVVAQNPKTHASRHAPGGPDDLSGSFVATNPTLSTVVRDAAGAFTSATESGVAVSVTRDSAGRIATVTTGTTTRTLSRDSAGRISGVA